MKHIKYWLATLLCLSLSTLQAEVKLPSFFARHMVLQRGRDIPVWGTADRHERVVVSIDGQRRQTRADKWGRWKVTLDSLPAGGPYTMEIQGRNNRIVISDVYLGDVWLCSGQSNMEMPVHGWTSVNQYADEIRQADYPLIRAFNAVRSLNTRPQNEVQGQWTVCSPATVSDYSATAYFFARHLHRELGVPIGIIHASWGGTEIESWIPDEAYRALPQRFQDKYRDIDVTNFERFAQDNEASRLRYEAAMTRELGEAGQWYLPSTDLSAWQRIQVPQAWEKTLGNFDGIVWFRTTVQLTAEEASGEALLALGMIDDNDATWVNGLPVGQTVGYDQNRSYTLAAGTLRPGTNEIVVRVTDNSGGGGLYDEPDRLFLRTSAQRHPLAGEWMYRTAVSSRDFGYIPVSPNMRYGVLYNAMIHPFAGWPIQGVIWYQGESNVGQAADYSVLFQQLIRAWRAEWGHEFPFYWVQLANYKSKDPVPVDSEWARLREAQSKALALPQTGQAIAADIGDANDLHPRNKQAVVKRLALIALRQTYGRSGTVASGPVFRRMTIDGNQIRIEYDEAGSGLCVPNKYGYIEGFAVAGEDRHFYWARAFTNGHSVWVSAPEVPRPVAVRYAWSDNPDINLYNAEGLPAVPFRTDNWDVSP